MPKLFEDPGVDEFNGLDLTKLKIDQAYIVVTSDWNQPTWLYALSDDCYQVSRPRDVPFTQFRTDNPEIGLLLHSLRFACYSFPSMVRDSFAKVVASL